jgi:hypothetical protein
VLLELDPLWSAWHTIEAERAYLSFVLRQFIELGDSLRLISQGQIVLLDLLGLQVFDQREES